MRSIADKSLIVVALEAYSVVSRLFDYTVRKQMGKLRLHDIEFEIKREDEIRLILDVHFGLTSYQFLFENNGWLSIRENHQGVQTERFSLGFYRDDHNFSYSGDREFCIEVCHRLFGIIKSGFNLS